VSAGERRRLKTLLLGRSGPELLGAAEEIKSRQPETSITIAVTPQFEAAARANSCVDHVYLFEKQRLGVVRGLFALLLALGRQTFDELIIPRRAAEEIGLDLGVMCVSAFIRAKRRKFLDEDFTTTDIRWIQVGASILHAAGAGVLTVIAHGLTRILAPWFSPSRPSPPLMSRGDRKIGGRVAVLVPIIPDVSHTFIYREVLAMIRGGATLDVIALVRGGSEVIHPEARELLRVTTFLPGRTMTRYLGLYIKWLVTRPRRFARMLAYFTYHCGEDYSTFLERDHYYHTLHPLQSIFLADLLHRLRVSHIHAYGASYPATMALGASLLLDIPYSFSTFVDFEHDYEYKLLTEKVRTARFVTASTRHCQLRLSELVGHDYREKIHVIHFGIAPGYGNGWSSEGTECATRPPRLLAVGRMVEKKGFDYLVRACGLLNERGLCVDCVIVGDGPVRPHLESLIGTLGLAAHVELVGPMPNDKLKSMYGPDTIVVMPCVHASDRERDGIPVVLLEAMSCGSPVVSTRISGIPELITDEYDGLLVADRDESALADAVERLLKSADVRRMMSKHARLTVTSRFDIDQKAQELWTLIGS